MGLGRGRAAAGLSVSFRLLRHGLSPCRSVFTAALADADLAPIGERLDPAARRLVAPAADDQDKRQRALALDDAALPQLLAGQADAFIMLSFDQHPAGGRQHAQHLAALAALAAGDDRHRVVACTFAASDDLGRERDDFRELSLARTARNRSEDARAHRILVGLDQDHRVAVESDVRSVPPPDLLDRPHHDGACHLTFFTVPSGTASLMATMTVSPSEA